MMMTRLRIDLSRSTFTVCVVAALLGFAGWASAQAAGWPSLQSGSSSLSQAISQAPVFKYYIWGQVRLPGAYSLGANPDIVELLSAAGGPTPYADVRHVVLVQAAAHKRIRIDLKNMLGTGQVVPLSPGDVVMMPNSTWYSVRDVLSVGTTVVSLATLVLSVMTWMKT